jgi:hypothetical protein
MSEWPERYSLYNYGYGNIDDVQIDLDHEGEYVKFEDFERLLTFVAKVFDERHSTPLDLYKLKESILVQLKKEAEND